MVTQLLSAAFVPSFPCIFNTYHRWISSYIMLVSVSLSFLFHGASETLNHVYTHKQRDSNRRELKI
jgi:hypothetical protein